MPIAVAEKLTTVTLFRQPEHSKLAPDLASTLLINSFHLAEYFTFRMSVTHYSSFPAYLHKNAGAAMYATKRLPIYLNVVCSSHHHDYHSPTWDVQITL